MHDMSVYCFMLRTEYSHKLQSLFLLILLQPLTVQSMPLNSVHGRGHEL